MKTLLEKIYMNLQDAADHKADAGYTNDPNCTLERYAGYRLCYPEYTISFGTENVFIKISFTVVDTEGTICDNLTVGNLHTKLGAGKLNKDVCDLLMGITAATDKMLADRTAEIESRRAAK